MKLNDQKLRKEIDDVIKKYTEQTVDRKSGKPRNSSVLNNPAGMPTKGPVSTKNLTPTNNVTKNVYVPSSSKTSQMIKTKRII